MTELATLRWGDAQTIDIKAQAFQEGSAQVFGPTKQLVMATWRVPMSWNVILVAVPFINGGDSGSYSVDWLFTLGAGQGTLGEVPLFTMTPFSNTNVLQQTQQLVPSQSLQIRARVRVSPVSTLESSFLLGAFVAPNNAEVFAEENAMQAAYEMEENRQRFMQMGGPNESPLHYQPIRR